MLKRTFANKTAGRRNGPEISRGLGFPRLGPFLRALAKGEIRSRWNDLQESRII
jgi:hypothetical protein